MSDLEFCTCEIPHPLNEAARRETAGALVWARLIGDRDAMRRLAAMLGGSCPTPEPTTDTRKEAAPCGD